MSPNNGLAWTYAHQTAVKTQIRVLATRASRVSSLMKVIDVYHATTLHPHALLPRCYRNSSKSTLASSAADLKRPLPT